jgi:hypothetical protein
MAEIFRWQIICYLVRRFCRKSGADRNMLIMLCIAAIVALLFGKISYKEIKKYVRKYTEGHGTDSPGGNNSGDSAGGGCGGGDCTAGGKEGEEKLPEEGSEEGKDC